MSVKGVPEVIVDRDYALQVLNSYAPGASDNYAQILLEAMSLHARKNQDYTHGEAQYGNFERVAQILKLYPSFPHDSREGVLITYALKQLDAVCNSLGRSENLKEEGIEGRLFDIGVYAFILLGMFRTQKRGPK